MQAIQPVMIGPRCYRPGETIDPAGIDPKRLKKLAAAGAISGDAAPEKPQPAPAEQPAAVETADAPPAERLDTETAEAKPKRARKR